MMRMHDMACAVLVASAVLGACATDSSSSSTTQGTSDGTAAGGATAASGGNGGAAASGGAGATGGAGSGGDASGGSAQGGAGGEGGGGQSGACVWDGPPCGTGQYCFAPTCAAGTCQDIPDDPDKTQDPVCGCDGVHYWNAEVAASHAMSVASTGKCAAPSVCEGFANLQCPGTSHCAKLYASVGLCGGADVGGECWGMPANCDGIVTIGGTWHICGDDLCRSDCAAILSEEKHFSDPGGCPQ